MTVIPLKGGTIVRWQYGVESKLETNLTLERQKDNGSPFDYGRESPQGVPRFKNQFNTSPNIPLFLFGMKNFRMHSANNFSTCNGEVTGSNPVLRIA
jgi:hypothetical protein